MNSRTNRSYRSLFWIAVVSVICFSVPAPAAQSVYFKPMIIEVNPYPGMIVDTTLEVFNGSDQTQAVGLALHDLTQGRNASWKIIGEGGTVNDANVPSCRGWVTLGETSVVVGPARRVKIGIRLRIPPKAKGFYLAGLTATLNPTKAPDGVGIVVRFLVPILIDIRARAQRQKLSLMDVGMRFVPETRRVMPTTFVTMTIANEGKTYSRVEGRLMIKKWVGTDWRRITELDFTKTKIIPGVEVDLLADIEKRLPSGQYKLFGQLKVDGRRVKPLEKIIKFEGDPAITSAATDAAIELSDREITIEIVPGATRNSIIQLTNASESGVVEVYVSLEMPEALKGGSLGTLRSEELTCPQWLTVRPNRFKLRAGARQNIKIIAKVPKTEIKYANYYARLKVQSRYANGQSAGNNSALICVHNKKVESKPAGQIMKLSLSAEKPSRYVITALFGNVGNIHFKPKCQAFIRNAEGKMAVRLSLKGDYDPMFPLEIRGFSEVADFSALAAGLYYVEAVMDYGAGNVASASLPIRVSVENREKIVEIVAPELQAGK